LLNPARVEADQGMRPSCAAVWPRNARPFFPSPDTSRYRDAPLVVPLHAPFDELFAECDVVRMKFVGTPFTAAPASANLPRFMSVRPLPSLEPFNTREFVSANESAVSKCATASWTISSVLSGVPNVVVAPSSLENGTPAHHASPKDSTV